MLSDPAHHLHLGSALAGQGAVGQPGPDPGVQWPDWEAGLHFALCGALAPQQVPGPRQRAGCALTWSTLPWDTPPLGLPSPDHHIT